MALTWYGDRVLATMRRAAMTAVIRCTENVRNEAIRLIVSTPKSGLVYVKRGGLKHQASAPGEAPASDTGTLVSRITTRYEEGRLTGIVSSSADYSPHLEYGTETMSPRPFMRPALNNLRKQIKADVRQAVANAVRGK